MLDSSVHRSLSCTDCHTSLRKVEDFPHSANLPGVNCASCIRRNFGRLYVGFYDHLKKRGFTNIPSCIACHGNHKVSKNADTRLVCGVCHNSQRKEFEGSIHFAAAPRWVNCTSCHSAHIKVNAVRCCRQIAVVGRTTVQSLSQNAIG